MQSTKTLTLKDWIIAVRPWSFPASAMPVIVAVAFLLWKGYDINWGYAVWALLSIILFHAAGNTWSDYHDFKSGVDTPETSGAKTLTSGQFQPRQIKALSLSLLALGVVSGVIMIVCTGITLLWIGLGGIVCTLLYPYMKYRAMGDLAIGITYAWLPVWGTSFVTVGVIDYAVLIPAIPVGMITIAILHANNTRDVYTDAGASITTLAMQMGHSMAAKLYAFWVLAPFAFVAVCVAVSLFPAWTLLSLFAFPVAFSNAKLMLGSSQDNLVAISNLDERTAQLQLMFSLLFTVSFIIAAFA